MPRQVRLLIRASDGTLLGALPAFEVESPHWPDVEPVIAVAREEFGIDVVVLRLLDAETGRSEGGAVTYLAELSGEAPADVELERLDGAVVGGEDGLRAVWARPGGVARIVGWADERLAALSRRRIGPAVQVKSWNLSSIMRLPTADGDVWCKSVPPFLAQEGAILGLVGAEDPGLVPPVLAADPATGTVLLGDVPGDDQWDAPEDLLIRMVRTWVHVQTRWAPRTSELLSAGLADWRAASLSAALQALADRPDVRVRFTDDELTALDALTADLPARLASLAECGLPETLVHGDFHPGNWRHDGDALVLLDWGDGGVGHPLFDLAAFEQRVPEESRRHVHRAWMEEWRMTWPGADPERAAALIAPVSALRGALIYQGFLDGIEASERIYHDADVTQCVRRALALSEWSGSSSPSSRTSPS